MIRRPFRKVGRDPTRRATPASIVSSGPPTDVGEGIGAMEEGAYRTLRSVIGVDVDVFLREITSPHGGTVTARLQIETDSNVAFFEDLFRAFLIKGQTHPALANGQITNVDVYPVRIKRHT
jgi:hypothetical protein